MGHSKEWWAQSGYCTVNAPFPTGDQRRKAAWAVKHASECCGDGLHVADAGADSDEETLVDVGETP